MTPELLEEGQEELKEYEKKAVKLLALARIYVKLKGPYFMKLLHTLVPVSVPGFGTLAVSDDLLLIYDPIMLVDDPELSALDRRGLPYKLGAVLVHECQHILRGMQRIAALAQTDKELANIAADLSINSDLQRAEWMLPSWGCFPEAYGLEEHQTMEWYFQELFKNPKDSKAKASGRVTGGSCGGVAGNPTDEETEIQEAHAGKGRSKARVKNAIKSTLSEAKRHFEGLGAGDRPGWFEEASHAFEESRRPERNWMKELAHVIRRTTGAVKSGGSDFSMSRPSRRALVNSKFLRPGMVEQEVEVDIFWDTSASMGLEQLNKARQVTLEVLRQLGLDSIRMAQGDTKIQLDFTRVRIKDVGKLSCHGRGGTSFLPVFARLRTLKPKPDIIMIVTDGDGPAPERPPPRTPVVWVIVPSGYRKKPTTWGHYVICSNDHGVADGFR